MYNIAHHYNMRPTVTFDRNECVRLLKEGKSYRSIASKLKISVGNVCNIASSANIDRSQHKGGHPRKLSDMDHRLMVRTITSGKCDNAKQLKRTLNLQCCPQTVRNALLAEGLAARVKIKKPVISQANIAKRLEFCERFKDNTPEDWDRIVWSDETKVNRFGSDGREYVWGVKGSRRTRREVTRTVKGGGGSVMVWGCFSSKGVGRLAGVEGNMTKEKYTKILDNNLFASTRALGYCNWNFIFQQDNDPKHKAYFTEDWFEDHNVQLLFWPPQSPDLNPIEHLWAHVKRQLNNYPTQPTSIYQLECRIQEVWNNIPVEVCQKLVYSMPDRIQAVLKAKGDWTDY